MKKCYILLVVLLLPFLSVCAEIDLNNLSDKQLQEFVTKATNGDIQAQEAIAHFYFDQYVKDMSKEENIKKSIFWFEKVAREGSIEVQYLLGMLNEIIEDYEKAVYRYTLAAESDYPQAQCCLGRCYYNGDGVEKNYETAFKWFKKSAFQGCDMGQNWLGKTYYFGLGVEKDYEKAVYWFSKAVNQSFPEAQAYLSLCYVRGLGCEQSDEKAQELLLKSAENDYVAAQGMLAEFFEEGILFSKDLSKAEYWKKRAKKNGWKK